jgi:REP element-mobilizing transposase RayT
MTDAGRRARKVARVARERQLELSFPKRWGGARRGAGRKRGPYGKVAHRARGVHRAAEPVHVTLRARLAVLRSQYVFPTVRLAFARVARGGGGFRVLHFSVQHNHVHLIVEADDTQALSRGMQGLAVRVARYVNDLLLRRGAFWADRWHGRALRTPREVRNALVYVLCNFQKHGARGRAVGIDPFSSGEWFDGWQEWRPGSGRAPPLAVARGFASDESVVVAARTWLAGVGWRRRGLVRLDEAPQT